ncbi:MAG: calcium-translocating P-type ATPase, PMCA-type [Dysgonamonadaceae bacterium]|jgi:Ca2+-transporting ATPase|nr:calcium-translocating P-type ATPase, PMCA-type [Dysgonamonadaceae bacterium]
MNPNLRGLNDIEIEISRQQYGTNLLTPPKKDSAWKLLLEKFKDPIIRILLIAAFLSLIVSFVHNDFAETIGIIFAILLAIGIGFWFELDANNKFDLLNRVNDETSVKVIRNKNICEISKKEIVVGDIVLLETGEEIPADGQLLEAISLQVNESSLTGEPVISKTTVEDDFDDQATYLSNRIYRGTTVVDGHCIMEVTSVGDFTEFGKVARESGIASKEVTPLNKQLDSLAKIISVVGFSLGILTFLALFIKDIFFGGYHNTFDQSMLIDTAGRILEYFMVAVTLIVVSVPEGLPMSVTLSLALSMRRMLKTNNLVRKMHACETMGAATVICTDKTGTLTQNQMQVVKTNFFGLKDQVLQADSAGRLIIGNISANSTAYLDFTDPKRPKALGNPTEAALFLWLYKNNINYLIERNNTCIVEQLTFSTERKYMATIVNSHDLNKKILYVKGAPEIILDLCKTPSTCSPTLASIFASTHKQLLQYQNQAMRTLGFAYKELENSETRSIEELVKSGMLFQGIVAISDPVRADVPEAVAKCLSAGIDIKIVTGDTPGTAKEIGRQIGIWDENDTDLNIIAGVEFEALPDEEALERVRKLKIMCRARPTDKQRLVQLLQKCGEIVAVTGDGTNDAPALNFAQVGLSMGSGTSVAKEASDITLLDDSFNSIATAVMWGRSLYRNIQRFLLFQLTINITALVVVFFGSLFGHELPLTVTQMLWVNLIMDTFAAGALASLPPDPKVMNEKPRKNTDFIITPKMGKNIVSTGVFFVVLLSSILYYFNSTGLDTYKLSCFFTIFVMLQFWNMFNAKAFGTRAKSAFSDLKESKGFILVSLLVLSGQFLIVQFGGEVFRTEPISLRDWGLIIGGTSSILWIGEIFRFVSRTVKSLK